MAIWRAGSELGGYEWTRFAFVTVLRSPKILTYLVFINNLRLLSSCSKSRIMQNTVSRQQVWIVRSSPKASMSTQNQFYEVWLSPDQRQRE